MHTITYVNQNINLNLTAKVYRPNASKMCDEIDYLNSLIKKGRNFINNLLLMTYPL